MTREGPTYSNEYSEPIKVFKCEEHKKSFNTKGNAGIINFISIVFLIISIIFLINNDNSNILGLSFIIFTISFISFFGSLIVYVHEDDICRNIYDDK